jgi:hypothetical protein
MLRCLSLDGLQGEVCCNRGLLDSVTLLALLCACLTLLYACVYGVMVRICYWYMRTCNCMMSVPYLYRPCIKPCLVRDIRGGHECQLSPVETMYSFLLLGVIFHHMRVLSSK